ncbi:hypothetical protein EGQ24_03015 [bacterium]|nr:hypothetical protein [bacterium]
MKISGYGIKNNNKNTPRTSFRQTAFEISAQQKFIDLMTSDKKMFKSWQTLHSDKIEIYAKDIALNSVPTNAINNAFGNADLLNLVKYPIENLLQATKNFISFKYNTLEKIYNNQTIMENRDTRETFIGLLGKVFANVNTEFLPEQQEIMNKFLDNERLYGCKDYFKYTKNTYNINDIFGRLFRVKSDYRDRERAKLSNEILQKILDNKNLNENQITEILKIMSHSNTIDNKELKVAKILVEEELLPPKNFSIEDNWYKLKNFLAKRMTKWDANEFIKDFKNDASIKNNKPFQDILSLVYKEYIADSKW